MLRRSAQRCFAAKSSGLVLVRKDDVNPAIAVVTLNNAEKLNALTVAMGDEFRGVMEDLRRAAEKDPAKLRAVVLTGSGRAFSAGGDLEFLRSRVAAGAALSAEARKDNKATMLDFYDRFLSIKRVPVPVLAAVNGHAVGAGLCLAMAADLRFVASGAKLSLNFSKIGLHPGMGASFHLPRLVGPQLAAKMILTGDNVDGAEAAAMGLCLEAVPAEQVLPSALALARRITASPPLAVNQAAQTLRRDLVSLHEALDRESTCQSFNFDSGASAVTAGLDAISNRK
ncbi:3-hydroxybutyryl-CoA dehydratase-like protein [Diplonema papillatum]|nr:3-hydroxybutyryl-CoA dehydratase-like protein [Diplonema papillatum]|eukprot:gene2066-3161_t